MNTANSLEAIGTLAHALVVVAEAGNTEAIAKFYAPRATLWHNITGVSRLISDHLASVPQLRSNIENRRWIDLQITPFADGYVQQWRITADMPDGSTHYMPICMICRVEDGKIVKREDYFDTAQLAALRSNVPAEPAPKGH